MVFLIQFNSVPPRPCLPLVARASFDLAEGVERSLRLEVALEPDRTETRNNNPEIIILSNRECDLKAIGVAILNRFET